MSSNIKDKISRKYRIDSYDKMDAGDFEEIKYNNKTKVECICPKCGQKHKMNFHWIGRGTPRKYCPTCKGSN
jgi:hypothetical protein